ncbi:ATP-dependent nuclease [Edwardsiella tarda]|uniref:ATP-dependent nuclease n=1 Tax=Edwardsiella tarda TaxID=636 RepID=UPI00098EA243|nr:AAA family ATPase [Edwardsiella tarda]
MFIKSIVISNFKGYSGNNEIIFSIPDGNTEGSGLNIFVGENNSGKSTVFEALDFIKDSTKKDVAELANKSEDGDVSDELFVEVVYSGNISGVVDAHIQDNKKQAFLSKVFSDGSQEYFRVKRHWCQDAPDLVKKINFWDSETENYSNPSGIDAPFKKFYDNNFIWADTNPSDESKFGSSTICGSLLKEIALGHVETDEYRSFQQSYHALFNNPESELREKISQVEKQVQDVFSSQFGDASISFSFDEIQIENFFKTASVIIDDGVSVPMGEKGHGMQRAVALSLLQVYANITATSSGSGISKPFYLLIDEPEICLHPLGQKKLLDALMAISKTKQVFITTHSPFILSSPHLKNAGLYIFKKDECRNSVLKADSSYLFPWSPTWGEVNYKAYNLATVDFHNELYGYLQEKSEKHSLFAFEQWLNSQGVPNSKTWTEERQGIPQQPRAVTLQTFIRNHIHHPENVIMQPNRYTAEELKYSIDKMITILNSIQ